MATSAPRAIAVAISAPLTRADLPGLCERAAALLERSGARVVLCDVARARADAVTVDALARLRVATRRRGCRLHLCGASPELLELVAFVGLSDVLRE
jgi:ABC-type transporter Mla MlaB component